MERDEVKERDNEQWQREQKGRAGKSRLDVRLKPEPAATAAQNQPSLGNAHGAAA
jgi:hypothetical protein